MATGAFLGSVSAEGTDYGAYRVDSTTGESPSYSFLPMDGIVGVPSLSEDYPLELTIQEVHDHWMLNKQYLVDFTCKFSAGTITATFLNVGLTVQELGVQDDELSRFERINYEWSGTQDASTETEVRSITVRLYYMRSQYDSVSAVVNPFYWTGTGTMWPRFELEIIVTWEDGGSEFGETFVNGLQDPGGTLDFLGYKLNLVPTTASGASDYSATISLYATWPWTP